MSAMQDYMLAVANSRCSSITEHYQRLMVFGWCPCGHLGAPRSQQEYEASRASRPQDERATKPTEGTERASASARDVVDPSTSGGVGS